ncbi:MAG: aminotransferase class I/II-fold pyridoxal phosphate-dependent enzyme [Treponema sp.]|jgi:cystathionine beta-lyase|nr:aminotransferase class I/II-fold pyridoxal phosphate-dependent enzyme [Treponema sp.]
MSYDFDAPLEIRGTGSDKWDSVAEGVIPLWVADMDFAAPPELTETLTGRASRPFYGYNKRRPDYAGAIVSWYREQYGVTIGAADILPGPGTVPSLGAAVRAFTRPGDGVFIMPPVYVPFYQVIRENGRKTVEAPMRGGEDGRFVFDRAAFEKAIDAAASAGVAAPLALFCSPHNPGGRVWSGEEIAAFLDFAESRNMIVAADEIHGDFVFGGEGGTPGGFVSTAAFPNHAGRLITVSGANKSFNIGGLHVSHIIVRDENLRAKLGKVLAADFHHSPDIFSELAVETCYKSCGPWLAELKTYIKRNLEEAAGFLNDIPGIKAWVPGGTYLLWARVQGLVERAGCKDDLELVERLESEAKVKITNGSMYGGAGAGYARINAACPRKLLLEGLGRIKTWAKQF